MLCLLSFGVGEEQLSKPKVSKSGDPAFPELLPCCPATGPSPFASVARSAFLCAALGRLPPWDSTRMGVSSASHLPMEMQEISPCSITPHPGPRPSTHPINPATWVAPLLF